MELMGLMGLAMERRDGGSLCLFLSTSSSGAWETELDGRRAAATAALWDPVLEAPKARRRAGFEREFTGESTTRALWRQAAPRNYRRPPSVIDIVEASFPGSLGAWTHRRPYGGTPSSVTLCCGVGSIPGGFPLLPSMHASSETFITDRDRHPEQGHAE